MGWKEKLVTALLCLVSTNAETAQVSTIDELIKAIEVDNVDEVIVDTNEIVFSRALTWDVAKPVIISGIVQSDGNPPKFVQQSISNGLLSVSQGELTLSNLAFKIAPAPPGTDPFSAVQLLSATNTGTIATSECAISSGICSGWEFVDGSCISNVSTGQLTWQAAEQACAAANGNLASIHSLSTSIALKNKVLDTDGTTSTWIGASFDANGNRAWSDASDAESYLWPLEHSAAAATGNCVLLDAASGGLWRRGPCDQQDTVHPYICSVGAESASFNQRLGVGNSVTHTDLSLDTGSVMELQMAHVLGADTPFVSIRYGDLVAKTQSSTFYNIQVKVYGTTLPPGLELHADSASSAGTNPVVQTGSTVFTLQVSKLPKYLQLSVPSTTGTATLVSKMEVLLDGEVALSSNFEDEISCLSENTQGTYNAYTAVGQQVQLESGTDLSVSLEQEGCGMFSLWTPTSKPSPLKLKLTGIDLSNLAIEEAQPVVQDGSALLLQLDDSIQLQYSFSHIEGNPPACLSSVSLEYHEKELGSFNAKDLFENCPSVCGILYDSANQCLIFSAGDQAITSASISVEDLDICEMFQAGVVSATKSTTDACTFKGAFQQATFNQVFDSNSGYSTFEFDSNIPGELTLPTANTILPKNRVLSLAGYEQGTSDAVAVQVPYFEISGTANFDFVSFLNGVKVTGQLIATSATLLGTLQVEQSGFVDLVSSTIHLKGTAAIVVNGNGAAVQLSGVQVPESVAQSNHLAQVSAGKLIASDVTIHNLQVSLANDMNKVRFLSTEQNFAYVPCSQDATAVSLNSLPIETGVSGLSECQESCRIKESCSAIGLNSDPTTGELICHHCEAERCVVSCAESESFFEIRMSTDFVTAYSCFATNADSATSLKQITLLQSIQNQDQAIANCNAICASYFECQSTTVSRSQSAYKCDMYNVDEIHTECATSQKQNISVRRPLTSSNFVEIEVEEAKQKPVSSFRVEKLRSLSECQSLCEVHHECDMISHDHRMLQCDLLSSSKPVPNWEASNLPSTVIVLASEPFPRVMYETIQNNFAVPIDDDEVLFEWAGRVSKLSECRLKCSLYSYCVAFAFADARAVSGDVSNCVLYNNYGVNEALVDSTNYGDSNTFNLYVATTSIGVSEITIITADCSVAESVASDEFKLYEDIYTLDECAAICSVYLGCNLLSLDYANSTCTIVPDSSNNDKLLCDQPHAKYFQVEDENPLTDNVRYVEATSNCLRQVKITPNPANSVTTLEGCKSMCDLHPLCFGFVRDTSNGITCDLLETIVAKPTSACTAPNPVSFYVSTHNPDRELYTRLPFNACFVVRDTDEGATVSQTEDIFECRKQCFEEANCRGFSFENGKCVLRDDVTIDVNSNCNPQDSYLESFEHYLQGNRTFTGEILLEVPIPVSLWECRALCDVFEECGAVAMDEFTSTSRDTHTNTDGKCILLTPSIDAISSTTFEHNGETLAVLVALDPYPFTKVDNLRVSPNLIRKIDLDLGTEDDLVLDQQSECEALCEVVEGCYSLTYNIETGECTFFEKNSWTEASYIDAAPRSSNINYLVSFDRFIRQIPQFEMIESRGKMFPDQTSFATLQDITTATLCQRKCLESAEDCGFAHYFPTSETCDLYPGNTLLGSDGSSPRKVCRTVQFTFSGTFRLNEVFVLDAHGVPMQDPDVVATVTSSTCTSGHEASKALDKSMNTYYEPQNSAETVFWNAEFCTQRPIHFISYRQSTGRAYSILASAPYVKPSATDAQELKFVGYSQPSDTDNRKLQVAIETELLNGYHTLSSQCAGLNGHLAIYGPAIPEECATYCDSMSECVAFNYDRFNGKCHFKNNAIAMETENCAQLDAYVADGQLDQFLHTHSYCQTVRVELDGVVTDGIVDKYLQLCEVEVFDSNGIRMFDPKAAGRARSNVAFPNSPVRGPRYAADGIGGVVMDDLNTKCFHSKLINAGVVGMWETTYCTPRPVSRIRVESRSTGADWVDRRINGARVYFTDSFGTKTTLEDNLEYKLGAFGWEWETPAIEETPTGCETVRVELEPRTSTEDAILQLCEVQIFDQDGVEMTDANAQSTAKTNTYAADSRRHPKYAVDGDTRTTMNDVNIRCFHSGEVVRGETKVWWEASFCVPRPIAAVRVYTRTGGVISLTQRINGAQVSVSNDRVARQPLGTLYADVYDNVPQSMFELPVAVYRDGCETIRIELEYHESLPTKFLQLCEVQALDANGEWMYDAGAVDRTTSSPQYSIFNPSKAVDGMISTIHNNNQCFHSLQVPEGRVAWWQTTFCTPKQIAHVRVLSRTDDTLNEVTARERSIGAQIYSLAPSGTWNLIGSIQDDTHMVSNTVSLRPQISNSMDSPPPEGYTCGTIVVDLSPDVGSYLQLCEVQILDSNGVWMFDPQAMNRVSTSFGNAEQTKRTPQAAVDGSLETDINKAPCYHSNYIPSTGSGWWKATFCTPKPAAKVRITTRTGPVERINGARVSFINDKSEQIYLGTLFREDTEIQWTLDIPQQPSGEHCETFSVELDGGEEGDDYIQLCEFQVLNAAGVVLTDTGAAIRATTNVFLSSNRHPQYAADGNTATTMNDGSVKCFHSKLIPQGVTGWWKTTFCPNQPIAKVRVMTRSTSDNNLQVLRRINGARVVHHHKKAGPQIVSSLVADTEANLGTFDLLGESAGHYCSEIRVDLEKPRILQLCEVQVLDSYGNVMFDEGAADRASTNRNQGGSRLPRYAADGDTRTAMNDNTIKCFHSSEIPSDSIGWWKTIFCTPRPIATVRVMTRSSNTVSNIERINDAVVYLNSGKVGLKKLGTLQYVNSVIFDLKTNELPVWNPNKYCANVEIFLPGDNKILQLCEVQLRDKYGVAMWDPIAGDRATTNSYYNQAANRHPRYAVDNRNNQNMDDASARCFHSGPDTTTNVRWKTTICTPRPPTSIHIRTRNENDIVKQRINGAKVKFSFGQNSLEEIGTLTYSSGKSIYEVPIPNSFSVPATVEPELLPGCSQVRIELNGNSSGRRLRLCDVQVVDDQGEVMHDVNTKFSARTTSKSSLPELAVKATHEKSHGNCFESEPISSNGVVSWSATYCTRKPVATVSIKTVNSELNGANVYLARRSAGLKGESKIGTVSGITSSTRTQTINVGTTCTGIQIELDGDTQGFQRDKYLQICDVKVFDASGNSLQHNAAQYAATNMLQNTPKRLPSNAVDTNPGTNMEQDGCFHSHFIPKGQTGLWKSTFCTATPVAKVKILTRFENDKDVVERINTARVKAFTTHFDNPVLLGAITDVSLNNLSKEFDVPGTLPGTRNCETIRIEQREGDDSLRLCNVRAYDKNGNEMFDGYAAARAASSSVIAGDFAASNALRKMSQLGGNSNNCFVSKPQFEEVRWWSSTVCLRGPIHEIRIETERVSSPIPNSGAVVSVTRSNGDSTYFGRILEHADVENPLELGIASILKPSQGKYCETIRVEGFNPTNMKYFHKQETLVDPDFLRRVKSGKYRILEGDDLVWAEYTICVPKSITKITFDRKSYGGKVWAISSTGAKRYLASLSSSPNTIKTEEIVILQSNVVRPDQELLMPSLNSGDFMVSLHVPDHLNFEICEVELLDSKRNIIVAEQAVVKASNPETIGTTSQAVDGSVNSCYRSNNIGSVPSHFAIIVRRPGTEVVSIRIHTTSAFPLPTNTKVYVRDSNNVSRLLGIVGTSQVSVSGRVHDFLPRDSDIDRFGQYLVPFDDVEFRKLETEWLRVGGAEVDNWLKFTQKTTEECASLCGEWYQCLGFYQFTSGHCTLRGGLTIGQAYDGSRRRLDEIDDTVAPTPSITNAPTTDIPTNAPTMFPTTPTSSPLKIPTQAPTAPRPTTSPTSTVLEASNFERVLGNFAVLEPEDNLCLPPSHLVDSIVAEGVSLEACTSLCEKHQSCAALAWDLAACRILTTRSGIKLKKCDKNDVNSVELIVLDRLLDDYTRFRMESLGGVVPESNSGTQMVGANDPVQCNDECLGIDACSMTTFDNSKSTPCTHYNEPQLSTHDSASSITGTSWVKVRNASFRRKENHALKRGVATQLYKITKQTDLSCIAICDLVASCDGFNYDKIFKSCTLFSQMPIDVLKTANKAPVASSAIDFYISSYVVRRSRFGGPESIFRLTNPVSRSDCEVACTLVKNCKAFVHSSTGECELSRWDTTPTGKLMNDQGMCLGESKPTFDMDTCQQISFRYVFSENGNASKGRLQNVAGKCVERNDNSNTMSLSSCSDARATHQMWAWETGSFERLLSDEKDSTSSQLGPVTELCYNGVWSKGECPNEVWSIVSPQHGIDSYVEVHITPDALQEAVKVTSPNVLFYRWLYGSEGKTARSLLAKSESMQRTINDFEAALSKVAKNAIVASTVVGGFQSVLGSIDSIIGGVGRFSNKLAKVMKIGTHIPYVKIPARFLHRAFQTTGGAVLKGVGKLTSQGQRVKILLEPLGKMVSLSIDALGIASNAVALLSFTALGIVNLGFCASQLEVQSKIVHADTLMKKGMVAIDNLNSVQSEVKTAARKFSSVASVVQDAVVKPVQAIASTFKPVGRFLKNFEFLITIFEYRVCFKLPIVGKVCLPTLEELGRIIGDIINFIKRIPFVGWVVSIVEDIVESVIDSLFPKFRIPLPSMSFNFGIVDEMKATFDTHLEKVGNLLDDMADVSKLLPFPVNLDAISDSLPSVDCENDVCNMSMGSRTIAEFKADGPKLPGLEIPSISIADDIQDWLSSKSDALLEKLEPLFDSTLECVEWGKPITCDTILDHMGVFGSELKETLNASGCEFNLPVCMEWSFGDGFDVSSITSEVGNLLSGFPIPKFSNSARRLDEEVDPFTISTSHRQLSANDSCGNPFGVEARLIGEGGLFTKVPRQVQKLIVNNMVFQKLISWWGNLKTATSLPSLEFSVGSHAKATFSSESPFMNILVGCSNGKMKYSLKFVVAQPKFSLRFVTFRTYNKHANKDNLKREMTIKRNQEYVNKIYLWFNTIFERIQELTSTEGGWSQRVLEKHQEEVLKFKQWIATATRDHEFIKNLNLQVTEYKTRMREDARDIIEDSIKSETDSKTVNRRRAAAMLVFDMVLSNKDQLSFLSTVRVHWKYENLFGGLTKFVFRTTRYARRAGLDYFLGSTDLHFNFIDLFKIGFLADASAAEFQNIIGPILPVPKARWLLDSLAINGLQKETNERFRLTEIGTGFELAFPAGLVVHMHPNPSCSLPGVCFDSPVCLILGFATPVTVSKQNGASCQCSAECKDAQCNSDGECGTSQSNSSKENENQSSIESNAVGIVIGSVSAIGVAIAGVVYRRRATTRTRIGKLFAQTTNSFVLGDPMPHGVQSTTLINQIGSWIHENETDEATVDSEV